MYRPKAEYRAPRPGEVLSFLSLHARKVESSEGLNIRITPCPSCARTKESTATTVNTQTGLWFCWACQAKGNFFTLTRAFGSPLAEDDRYLEPPELCRQKIDKGWREMRTKGFAHQRRPVVDGHYPELLAYLHARGFSDATLYDWRVSTMGPKALRWPLYARDQAGEWSLCNSRLRVCIDRAAAKTSDWFEIQGGETNLLLGNHLLDLAGPKRVLIAEGQFDAMTAYEIGLRNVFSLPNGASHVDVARMLRYIPDDWEVWIASDMDKAGDLCAEAFFAALGPDRLARVHMPAKDLNAWHSDLGLTLTPKMIEAALVGFTRMSTAAKTHAPVAANSHWMDLTKDDEAVRPVAICDTPWPLLTELLDGGLKPSQTTGVLAPSGTGKTTIVTQWGIHAAASQVKTGIITLEGDKTSIASKIKEQIRGYCSPSQMAEISRYLLVSQLNGSSVKWTEVIAEMEIMAQEGCKLIIVDNLDYIMPRTSMNIATQQKIQAYGRIMDIGKEYDIHSLVVWQPLKIEAGQVVNSGHQKGAAQLFQDADNYLNLNHIDGLARLEIEKCRDIGGKGGQVWLRYEATKRCLFEVAAPPVDSAVDAALPLGSVSKLNFSLARSNEDGSEPQALSML